MQRDPPRSLLPAVVGGVLGCVLLGACLDVATRPRPAEREDEAARLAAETGAPACAEGAGAPCRLMRIPGRDSGGELGFRFGEPLDMSGDGVADIAAGARFARIDDEILGVASVYSGRDGSRHRRWVGEDGDALWGHIAVPVPDIDGDAAADLIVAAPNRSPRSLLVARSPRTGKTLWTRAGPEGETFAWDLARAGDHNGDGHEDLYVGSSAARSRGSVHLVDGTSGATLARYGSGADDDGFGWYVDATGDVDGDGRGDLVVGAPRARVGDAAQAGAAYLVSSATGEIVHVWRGSDARGSLGEMVAGLGDLDGDGIDDVAIGAPHMHATSGALAGEVLVVSGRTGEMLQRWRGRQRRELYGRMVAAVGDVDGDEVGDVAVGAPWFAAVGARHGRVEVRSGRSGEVIAEIVGDAPDRWLGWHIAPAGGARIWVSSVRSAEAAGAGTGALELYRLR